MAAHLSANATVAAHFATAVTPSDSTVLQVTRGLYVGTTGAVAVTMADGGDVIFVNVPSGSFMPIQITKVLSTGTTAADILALY